jgi:hypothetical protein
MQNGLPEARQETLLDHRVREEREEASCGTLPTERDYSPNLGEDDSLMIN